MTDNPRVLTISADKLNEIALNAYNQGRADAMADVVPGETHVSMDAEPDQATVEAMLDKAFAPLRAELDEMVIRPDQSQR